MGITLGVSPYRLPCLRLLPLFVVVFCFLFFFFVFFFATMVCARLAIPQAPKESPVHIGIQG
jgi:hypothetical protein